MALHRSGSNRSNRNGDKDDEEIENNGYIQIFIKPLEQANYSVIFGWLGLSTVKLSRQQVGCVYGAGVLLVAALLYHLLLTDLGYLFHRICGHIVPIFCVGCGFYWLALVFRKSWSNTSVYILFCACFAGELLGQFVCDGTDSSTASSAPSPGEDPYITRPLLALAVLLAVSLASVFSTLETIHSTFVIVFVSLTRYLACTSLTDLPQTLRPFVAYVSGIAGVIAAKYMETVFKPPVNNYNNMTQDGKIPVIKRRRSSSSTAHGLSAHRVGRRTSLPALIHSRTQSSTASYESAIIGEAHGLITDMLVDASLPPHVVSGLRAVSNLLKPQENHSNVHKPKVSPLVSLTETGNYGSDSEDLPYTGERPSSLPKRLRRSLPPSLIRRMSTSTWTTTTSATGMPTLEAEPCRTRSSSFRHSRENTPGSSPTGSRSNSPSPSSPTTISLTIPKSRSFSLASLGPTAMGTKRRTGERRSVHQMSSDHILLSPVKSSKENLVSPSFSKPDTSDSKDGGRSSSVKDIHPGLSKRLNITSDYESSDSPGSSDHSDNVMGVDDSVRITAHEHKQERIPEQMPTTEGESLSPRTADARGRSSSAPGIAITTSTSGHLSRHLYHHHSYQSDSTSPSSLHQRQDHPGSSLPTSTQASLSEARDIVQDLSEDIGVGEDGDIDDIEEDSSSTEIVLPYKPEDLDSNELLNISRLTEWDYPIFDLAAIAQTTILSKVAYRLFNEVGLFDTFRIPVPEFLNFFHELELGYREKPYHNRVHATDVLHGVYYFTTQPIPGFTQVNPEGDVFHKLASSNSEPCERYRTSFTAEDSYGIMGGNFPPLELMALYAAAAMHDYDHPGRTNAFLVATHSPLAVLYNDRSVLESHHAASAWRLFLTDPKFNWLCHLEKAEFKRFRFLVIEAILATDLKRHFEMVAEFNAKVNDEDAPGIDWTVEQDRLMVANMVIKLADINGPCKVKDLHVSWTDRITEEFYEQGDEEMRLGFTISPYMDRQHPQLAKLQESFINHLVAPLCNCVAAAGLLPGTWVEEGSDTDGTESDKGESSACKDTEDEDTSEADDTPVGNKKPKRTRKMHCWLTKNLKDNHDAWVKVLKKENAQKERETKQEELQQQHLDNVNNRAMSIGDKEMEPITEEDTPPNSANSVSVVSPSMTASLLAAINAQCAAVSQSESTSTMTDSLSTNQQQAETDMLQETDQSSQTMTIQEEDPDEGKPRNVTFY
jgi:cGMP-inhibited 3',5'-cyclic phosphodiesterase A